MKEKNLYVAAATPKKLSLMQTVSREANACLSMRKATLTLAHIQTYLSHIQKMAHRDLNIALVRFLANVMVTATLM
jgi:hypothetical protein